MDTIQKRLADFIAEDVYPFHMPGHKRDERLHGMPLFETDITEIPGFDNLHNPTGIIRQAQQKAAATFGAGESFFLVNGSTVGVLAAIITAVKDADKVLIARNAHKSAFSALQFSGAEPVYVLPERIEAYGLTGGVSPQRVKACFAAHKGIKAVVLTSPTYEGFTSDVAQIAAIAHENNAVLIVDEAHGAHFGFSQFFPVSALSQGADMVIHSVHKTLPSLTQTALLHVGKNSTVSKERLRVALSMLQTTSPSYLFLSSIDNCRQMLDSEGKQLFAAYEKKLADVRKALSELQNIRLIGKELAGSFGIQDVDLGKLVFVTPPNAAVPIEEALRKQYRLQMEMAAVRHFIAMTSIMDNKDGLDRLTSALRQLDQTIAAEPLNGKGSNYFTAADFMPVTKMRAKDVFFANHEKIEISALTGKQRVSWGFVYAYPPGIPILAPGEVITDELLQHMQEMLQNKELLIGVEEGKYVRVVAQGLE